MVEFVKGKALIGPVVAIIGGLLLLIAGLIGLTNPIIQLAIALGLGILVVPFAIALIFGLLGILAGLAAAIGKEKANYVAIIIGLIATIGMFIPLFLVSLAYIDPILILVGGVLGIIIKE